MKLNERNDIGQLLMLAHRDFHTRLGAELKLMGVTEISSAQGTVMTHIFYRGPSRMVDIAEFKGVRSQSLLKVINELEVLSYVRRIADDRDSRAKLIELTSLGLQHMEFLSDATERVWQQYVEDVGANTTKQVFSGLRKILINKS